MLWFRELFEIDGWKKYSLALIAMLIGGVALPTDNMTGTEFVGLVSVITAFFGASDVGAKWVTKQGSTDGKNQMGSATVEGTELG